MFDFSMAGVDAKDIDAGTLPYLDPFLGTGDRRQFDTAAERYGAAVVLFEMATGTTPQYGPDPDANPATVDDDVDGHPGHVRVDDRRGDDPVLQRKRCPVTPPPAPTPPRLCCALGSGVRHRHHSPLPAGQ